MQYGDKADNDSPNQSQKSASGKERRLQSIKDNIGTELEKLLDACKCGTCSRNYFFHYWSMYCMLGKTALTSHGLRP